MKIESDYHEIVEEIKTNNGELILKLPIPIKQDEMIHELEEMGLIKIKHSKYWRSILKLKRPYIKLELK